MRNSLKLLAPVSLIVLAACSEASQDAAGETDYQTASQPEAAVAPADAAEETVADAAAESAPASDSGFALPDRPDIPVTLPKMAYVFDYGFRLAGEAIAPLQQQHADMCEAQCPYA